MKITQTLNALSFCCLLALSSCAEDRAGAEAVERMRREQLQKELSSVGEQLPAHDMGFFVSQRKRETMRRRQIFAPLVARMDTFRIDTAEWLRTLSLQYQLPASQPFQLAYTRSALQGSYEDSLHIVELYAADPAENRQFVWDERGQLLHEGQSDYFAFLRVDSTEAPYLLLSSAQRPYFRLLAYSSTSGVLIDKIDLTSENLPALRDADTLKYANGSLLPSGEDTNADGYTDLVFSGARLLRGNKTAPLRYVFLFRRAKDAFFFEEG